MKRLLALLATCALGLTLQAAQTKYICSMAGITTEEFGTQEECNKACFQPGLAAVCEKTEAETTVVDTEDTEDLF